MGLFDKMKSALGGGDNAVESIKGPSTVLREAGIDPTNLDFSFAGDGTVTISGYVPDEATSARVAELVGGISQVAAVDNQVQIGAPAAPEPPPAEPEPAVEEPVAEVAETPAPEATEPAAPDGAEPQTYTVQAGDTLWNIAKAHYGEGSKYMDIFEANRDLLSDPDRIQPGQELKLP